MTDRAQMALFDAGYKLELPNGYYLKKTDDDRWQIGGPIGDISADLGNHITSNVGLGRGGSIDHDIRQFADAMNDTVERAAAALWRAENPDKSVFACEAEEKERYRQRIRDVQL